MIQHIAFLHGINVSGRRIIKMEELRKMFEELKFKNVRTYIQTGNVIFETSSKSSDLLTKKIERHLHKSLGFEIDTMLRSISEIEIILKDNPFNKVKLDKMVHLYLTFLREEPSTELKKSLLSQSDNIANYKIKRREVYTLYQRSNAKHPFSNNFVEKKLKVAATTRNWTVMNKILDFVKK